MLKICSWCESIIGWYFKSKGESHGICLNCLQEYFPQEAALLSSISGSIDQHRPGVGVTICRIRKDRPIEDAFINLLPAGLLRARKNLHISRDALYGNQ